MSHLLLPGHVSDEYEMGVLADIDLAMGFRQLLKQLDEHLDLIWVKEGAVNFPKPGRWYIVRKHPGGNDELNAYWVIEDRDGNYCVPGDEHIERLRQMDSHTRDVYEDIRQRRTWQQAAKRKAFDEKRAEFVEKLEERAKHMHGVQIAVPDNDVVAKIAATRNNQPEEKAA